MHKRARLHEILTIIEMAEKDYKKMDDPIFKDELWGFICLERKYYKEAKHGSDFVRRK